QDQQLNQLLETLASQRTRLSDKHGKRVPLALKIAPDLEDAQIASIADAVRRHRIDALIATNTSVSREGVEGMPHAAEAGGLSGAPIRERASLVLQKIHRHLKN